MTNAFLNLDLIQDLDMSSESLRRHRVQEGDEDLS